MTLSGYDMQTLASCALFALHALYAFSINAWILLQFNFFYYYLWPFLMIYGLIGWNIAISSYDTSKLYCITFFILAFLYYIGITCTLIWYLAPSFISGFIALSNVYGIFVYRAYYAPKEYSAATRYLMKGHKDVVLNYLRGKDCFSRKMTQFERLIVVHLLFIIDKKEGKFNYDPGWSRRRGKNTGSADTEHKLLKDSYNRYKSVYIIGKYLNEKVISPYNELVQHQKYDHIFHINEYIEPSAKFKENEKFIEKMKNVKYTQFRNKSYHKTLLLNNYLFSWIFPLGMDYYCFLNRHTILYYIQLSLFIIWIGYLYYVKYLFLIKENWNLTYLWLIIAYVILDVLAIIFRICLHHYHDRWVYVTAFYGDYQGEKTSIDTWTRDKEEKKKEEIQDIHERLDNIYQKFLVQPRIFKILDGIFERDIVNIILEYLDNFVNNQ